MRRFLALAGAIAMTLTLGTPVARAAQESSDSVRFATFNASLNRAAEGDLRDDLATPDDQQAQNVAETIQRVDPDVVLINEFDYDPVAVDLFRDNYLERSHHGSDPIEMPYSYVAPSNTGVPSGHDLDNDGTIGGGNDAYGFGNFEGQYGMVVYSKYPIDTANVRTFQNFLWQDMPDAIYPEGWYSADELADLRLSSKSHWDVPIEVGNKTVHFLTSHPTPPTFDGDEDRNGTRNHDEIRFWADYVRGASYIYDDDGQRGGLRPGERFVVAGDMNADPHDGDSVDAAIDQLLDHPRINAASTPASDGGREASDLQGGANDDHVGDPSLDTADFADTAPGNLRVDYVLPSKQLRINDSGVFWPTTDDPLYRLTGAYPPPTSDHRLTWIDVR